MDNILKGAKFLLWYQDPTKFFRDIFNQEPYPYQARVLISLKDNPRRIIIMAGGGTGKTKLLACIALWLTVVLPKFIKRAYSVIIISGSKDQAKYLYEYSKFAIQDNEILQEEVEGEPLISVTYFKDRSLIMAVPNSLKAIQGKHMDCAIVDEGSLAGDFIIQDTLRIVSTSDRDLIILSGTPMIYSTMFVEIWEEESRYPEWIRYNWCYDQNTELLTEDGWKNILEIPEQKKIAIVKGNKIFFEIPFSWFESEYNGEMIKFSGRHINCLVTPNHKMIYLTSKSKEKTENAENFLRIKAKSRKFLKTFEWNSNHCLDILKIGKNIFKGDDFLEFLGWYLSEGSSGIYKNKDNTKKYLITISQNFKSSKYFLIRKLLKKMNINFYYHGHQFYFKNKDLCIYLNKFGKCKEKYIPREFLDLERRQLKILWNSLMLGDGCFYKNRMSFYSTSKRLSDDFMELSLKLGYSVSVSYYKNNYLGKFVVYLSKRKTSTCRNIEKINYSGKIKCPFTSSGKIIIRRNGKVMLCGNSAKDCPNVSLEKWNEASKLPDDMFTIFWQGKPFAKTGTLIPSDEIKNASRDVPKLEADPRYEVIAGLDWGWRHFSAIVVLQLNKETGKMNVLYIDQWHREDFEDMHEKIVQICKDYKVTRVYADAEDIGENQRLAAKGINVIPVPFNQSKIQMQSHMKILFHQDKIRIPESFHRLILELRKYNWDTKTDDDLVDALQLGLKGLEEEKDSWYFEII